MPAHVRPGAAGRRARRRARRQGLRAAVALVALVAAALALLAAGCGEDEPAAGSAPATPSGPARVFVAASLRDVVAQIAPDAVLSAGGSDRLSRQIRAGAPADVLVAAAPREPEALRAAGLCGPPRPFASNSLVLLARPGSPLDDVRDLLSGPPRRLAVGTPGVPIGGYTRQALERLDASAVLERNRVSLEPSVAGIVTKVALGSADAGIAYATDARAARGRVQATPLPARAQPSVTAVACAVRRPGVRTAAAARVLDALTSAAGQERLRAAGFGPPPST